MTPENPTPPSTSKTADLLTALELADPGLVDLLALLRPELSLLSDKRRARLPRPLNEFQEVAPVLCQAMSDHPRIAAAAEFDPAEVALKMKCGALIDQLSARVCELQQLLADTHLDVMGTAWSSSLDAYRLAKGMEKKNPGLRQIIAPMAEVFKASRATAVPATRTTAMVPMQVG